MRRHLGVLVLAFAVFAACGGPAPAPKVKSAPAAPKPASGAAPWPAPSNPLELARKAGLVPEVAETLQYHVHAHLDIFVNGEAVIVPAGIGINIKDPGVQHGAGPSYGGIKRCKQPCISPLHTHDPTGVVHTESKTAKPNLLGQFFTEWDVKLDRSCVGGYCKPDASIQIFVNGEPFTGDPARISLQDKKEIAIVIGSPPKEIPSEFPAEASIPSPALEP